MASGFFVGCVDGRGLWWTLCEVLDGGFSGKVIQKIVNIEKLRACLDKDICVLFVFGEVCRTFFVFAFGLLDSLLLRR